jgi:hypothetical protein
MNRQFLKEWQFSLEHEDALNEIVARDVLTKLFKKATMRQDMMECTDALFVGGSSIRIAHRVRRIENTGRRRDFTIRWSLSNGRRTEVDKLRESQVTVYVYAWFDEVENRMDEYIVVDVKAFVRSGLIDNPQKIMRVNSDGNEFGCWSIYSIQDGGCLISGQASMGRAISHRWVSSADYLAARIHEKG